MSILLTWIGYGLILLLLARMGRNNDAVLPGKVNGFIQALAYVATYISAVALVGFGGLCHQMGMQMMLIAAGNMWLGTWFVYRYLAWPTKKRQEEFQARTPAHLISQAYQSPKLRAMLGVISSLLLVVYSSAVYKGAALMLAEALPLNLDQALFVLVALVAVTLLIGGLRGVLYTEAFQGGIMCLGVGLLLVGTIQAVGGVGPGLSALAALPPTPEANKGFMALSSGAGGMNVIFLTMVTSVGIWAQPQLIQRHFALANKASVSKAAPLAVLVIGLIVGGAYFASALSRLILPEVASPDLVIPTLVSMLLPEFGRQLFVIAIVSASLSTVSALMHIAASGFGEDIKGRKLSGWAWIAVVLACAITAGVCAKVSSQIIATICTTSWTLVASALMVPYLALLAWGRQSPLRGWFSVCAGLASSLAWYIFAYGPTSLKLTGLAAPGLLASMHPLVIGLLCSAGGFALAILIEKMAPAWPATAASAAIEENQA